MYDSSEQEYTPTEARLRERVKGSLGEYAYEFGIDGEAAMDEWIDQALAERDNRVRAEERAKQPDLPCDRGCNVNDGPMEDCSQHGRSPRDLWGIIEDQSQRLAAEPAKRPDREQIARALFEANGRRNYDGSPTPWHLLDLDEQAHYRKLADAVLSSLALEPETREERPLPAFDPQAPEQFFDAVRAAFPDKPEAREESGQVEWGVAYRQNDGKLFVDEAVDYEDAVFRVANSSVYDMVVQRRVTAYAPVGAAPAPEAREEPKHGLIEDYTAVQAPDWTKVSGKLDARDITDAEVHVLYIEGETYGYATFGGIAGEGIVDLKMTRQQWHDLGNPKEVAVCVTKREAAREVSRG